MIISSYNIQDEASVLSALKKMLNGVNPNNGTWPVFSKDEKGGFKTELLDGSYIRLRFFDCLIHLKDVRGNVLPGKESNLSYIDVTVMPKGVKGFMFKMESNRYLWKFAPAEAKKKHADAIGALHTKAKNLGIDLSEPKSWETYYVGSK